MIEIVLYIWKDKRSLGCQRFPISGMYLNEINSTLVSDCFMSQYD
jgi:hypothetical protein